MKRLLIIWLIFVMFGIVWCAKKIESVPSNSDNIDTASWTQKESVRGDDNLNKRNSKEIDYKFTWSVIKKK